MHPTSAFASLGLSAAALTSLEQAGYRQPTPIQQKAIPHALAGRDLIGCAATGTGKTAAFVVPLVERLAGRKGTRALVLAPTRELALQIAEHLATFGRSRGVRGAVVIGGAGIEAQARELRDGLEVLIATPGRLIDHLERGSARLNGIEVLVLDEADRMLDMGFRAQLERILARLPKVRQTMLFSATMAGEVAEFARCHLGSPERVEISRSGTVAERAEQRVFHVPEHEKAALMLALLSEGSESTLVFTRTKRRADRLHKTLARAGHDVARLHADRTQSQRRSALEGFKDGSYRVLVATDIAARGLDIEEIGHVVLFDLPHVPEDYVHRVGRTARAAASGRASSFCAPLERPLLRDIERLTRRLIPVADVPRGSRAFLDEVARRPAAQPEAQRRMTGERPARRPRAHCPITVRRERNGAATESRGPRSADVPRRGFAAPGVNGRGSSSDRGARAVGTADTARQGHARTAATPASAPRSVGSWRPRHRR
jgi:ATP-dependent RNA helicase RhlE